MGQAVKLLRRLRLARIRRMAWGLYWDWFNEEPAVDPRSCKGEQRQAARMILQERRSRKYADECLSGHCPR